MSEISKLRPTKRQRIMDLIKMLAWTLALS